MNRIGISKEQFEIIMDALKIRKKYWHTEWEKKTLNEDTGNKNRRVSAKTMVKKIEETHDLYKILEMAKYEREDDRNLDIIVWFES